METGIGLGDLLAVMNNNRDDCGFGGWMWIFIIFILFIFGRGWGNNERHNDYATKTDLYTQGNFTQLENGVRGLERGMCDGFYTTNTNTLAGFGNIGEKIVENRFTTQQGMNMLGSQIAENRFAAQQCCCDTKQLLLENRYEAQKNTCDITNAIHCEGEATRQLIQANTIQELRDRLEARNRDLLTANFQLSQQAQSANLIDQLRPCAKPAYLSCSPYQAFPYGAVNGLNGNGCGCGNSVYGYAA